MAQPFAPMPQSPEEFVRWSCDKGYAIQLKTSQAAKSVHYLERLVDGIALKSVVPLEAEDPGFALSVDVVRAFCRELDIPVEEFGIFGED